jgi:uncharacterized membrane protein YdbT with pleckstrin-like domain
MDLSQGERELFRDHPSWRSLFLHYLGGTVVAIIAGVIAWQIKDTTFGVLVGVIVFVLVLVIGYMVRMATRYVITNERLHIRRGLFSRTIQQARLERVQDMAVRQGLFERMLLIGTVDFDTAGGDRDEDFAFRGVAHPEKVMHEVDRAIRGARGELQQQAAAATAPAQAAPPPVQAPPPSDGL